MTFGLELFNEAGHTVASSNSYNMHYLGQAAHFSSQKFQSTPSSQYDNFYITSDLPPMPFIVNRPGRYSTILSINRDAVNPQNWNIVVLTGDAAPHSIGQIHNGDSTNFWPQISANFLTKYSFAFNVLPPPTVLCFAKLPAGATTTPGSFGLAIFDANGRLSFDSQRLPLDPDYVGLATVPAPGFYRSRARGAGSSAYEPGQMFYFNTINIPGWTAIDVGLIAGEAATYFGPMPANPAFFFASEAEAFSAYGSGGVTGTTLGQNYVPALQLSGGYAFVKWASRAAMDAPATTGSFERGVQPSMTLIIDADRYL